MELTDKVWQWIENRALTDKQILALEQHSPLGRVLCRRALEPPPRPRGDDRGHRGRRAATSRTTWSATSNTLGTIAAISPLLGLLGTVTA